MFAIEPLDTQADTPDIHLHIPETHPLYSPAISLHPGFQQVATEESEEQPNFDDPSDNHEPVQICHVINCEPT